MNILVRKSLSHLYRVFKVYLSLGIFGALAVIAYGVIVSEPLVVLISLISVGLLAIIVLLWFQATTASVNGDTNDKQPPKLPEAFMTLMLPTRFEPLIRDLRREFTRLVLKYGRVSAATWYAVQSLSVIIRTIPLELTSGIAKRFVATKKPS